MIHPTLHCLVVYATAFKARFHLVTLVTNGPTICKVEQVKLIPMSWGNMVTIR